MVGVGAARGGGELAVRLLWSGRPSSEERSRWWGYYGMSVLSGMGGGAEAVQYGRGGEYYGLA